MVRPALGIDHISGNFVLGPCVGRRWKLDMAGPFKLLVTLNSETNDALGDS
jgi:hypothetical protein